MKMSTPIAAARARARYGLVLITMGFLLGFAGCRSQPVNSNVSKVFQVFAQRQSFTTPDSLLTVTYFDLGSDLGLVLRANSPQENPLLLVDTNQSTSIDPKIDLSYGIDLETGRLCVSYMEDSGTVCSGTGSKARGSVVSNALTTEVSLRIPKVELGPANAGKIEIALESFDTVRQTRVFYPEKPFVKTYELDFQKQSTTFVTDPYWPASPPAPRAVRPAIGKGSQPVISAGNPNPTTASGGNVAVPRILVPSAPAPAAATSSPPPVSNAPPAVAPAATPPAPAIPVVGAAPAPSNVPSVDSTIPPPPPAVTAPQRVMLNVEHHHTFGGDRGVMEISSGEVKFESDSPADSFDLPASNISRFQARISGNTIEIDLTALGKTFRFSDSSPSDLPACQSMARMGWSCK